MSTCSLLTAYGAFSCSLSGAHSCCSLLCTTSSSLCLYTVAHCVQTAAQCSLVPTDSAHCVQSVIIVYTVCNSLCMSVTQGLHFVFSVYTVSDYVHSVSTDCVHSEYCQQHSALLICCVAYCWCVAHLLCFFNCSFFGVFLDASAREVAARDLQTLQPSSLP